MQKTHLTNSFDPNLFCVFTIRRSFGKNRQIKFQIKMKYFPSLFMNFDGHSDLLLKIAIPFLTINVKWHTNTRWRGKHLNWALVGDKMENYSIPAFSRRTRLWRRKNPEKYPILLPFFFKLTPRTFFNWTVFLLQPRTKLALPQTSQQLQP